MGFNLGNLFEQVGQSGAPAPAPAPAATSFGISSSGYGGGSLSSLGINPANYQTNNNYGLEDYIDPSKTAATIGGQQYRIQADPSQGQLKLYDPNNEQAGGYLYDTKGNFQNWAPYMATPSWASDVGQFAVTAAGMGMGLNAMGFTGGEGVAGAGLGGAGAGSGAVSSPVYSPTAVGTPLGGASPGVIGAGGAGAAGAAAGGGGGAAAAASGLTGNPMVDKILAGAGSSAVSSGLGGLFNGSSGGNGASNLGGLLSGAYDYYKQNQAADNMLNYMKTQQSKIDSIYDPNGPLAKQMYAEMSAKDAAAGRNSQYGTRTTEFLGRFGGDYAKYTAALAQGLAGNYKDAYNQQASAGTGLATGIGKAVNGGLNSLFQNGTQNMSSYVSSSPYDGSTGFGTGSNYGNEDYGQYL